MKKFTAGIVAGLLLLSIGLVGCTAKAPTGDTSWKDIQAKGEFVVGLDVEFPPMGFKDEKGEIVGFDIDLAKEAAKRMGVKVKFQPVVWDSVMMELKSKKIDVIWNGCTITEKRKADADFTKPYIQDKQILVVKKGSAVKGKADLKGKTVGLQSGSSSQEALDKDEALKSSLKKVVPFSGNNEALMDLANGNLDAVVVDEVVGRYYIAKKADLYSVLDDYLAQEAFGVAVRKGEASFLAELQKAIDAMKADGTSAKISTQWFGKDIVE